MPSKEENQKKLTELLDEQREESFGFARIYASANYGQCREHENKMAKLARKIAAVRAAITRAFR